MKNKILLGTVAFVAVLAVIGILAVSFTMTPVLATNLTNVTEKINVSCTTAIAVPKNSIDVGTGYIPQSCIDCWIGQNTTSCKDVTSLWNDTSALANINTKHFWDKCWVNTTTLPLPDYIWIKNKGNNYIDLSINLREDSDWLLQSGGDEFGDNAIEVFLENGFTMGPSYSNDNADACVEDMVNGDPDEASLALDTPVILCGAMAWQDNQNEVFLFDKFLINPKTEAKEYTLIKEISATEVNCSGTYTPSGDPPMSAVQAFPPTTTAPGAVAFQSGSWGSWTLVGTPNIDTTTPLSESYSMAADSGSDYAIIGIDFGTESGGAFNYRYFDGVATFAAKTISGITATPADFNAIVDGLTGGGTSIAAVSDGIYLTVGHDQPAGTAIEGALYSGGGVISGGFGVAYLGPAWNLCTAASITCINAGTFPAALVDMSVANNAAETPMAVLGTVFSDIAGVDKFAVIGVDSTGSSLIGSVKNIPGLAATDIVRDAAYTPVTGELCLWVDAAAAAIYGNSAGDNVSCFIALRNGNNVLSLLPINNFPGLLFPKGGANSAYGIAFSTPNMPPGFGNSVQAGPAG
jgi:hypothetical protein